MKHYANDFKDAMSQGLKLAKSLGSTATQISFTSGDNDSVEFENGRLKYASASQRLSYAISVVVNGKRGSAVGNQPENLPDLIRRAVELARIGAQSHFTAYPKPAEHYHPLRSFDPKVRECLTRDKLLNDCKDLVDTINAMEPNLTVDAGAGTSQGEALSMNDQGLVDAFQVSSWNIGAGLQKTTGTDMLNLYAGRGWQELNHFYDLDYIKNRIRTDLQRAGKFDSLPDGKVPLVVPPLIILRFLKPLFMGINGRNVFRGTSPLAAKLGEQLFNPALSMNDDPFIDFDSSSANMDEAGIPAQKLDLVQNGVIPQFLYDYDTACMAKTDPTGNSNCAPYNPTIKPGTNTAKELMRQLPQAVYIKRLLGFGQGNFRNGDFSANVSLGFVVRNGEFSGRLKNVMISGNIFEMLKQPILVSSDVNPVNRQPTVIFPEVNLFAR